VELNTRRFNAVQGIVLGTLAGIAGWTLLIGVTMWAVTA
jgi:hypothetical protein